MVLLTTTGKVARTALSTIVSLALSGCGAVTTVKQTFVSPPTLGAPIDPAEFLGGVAADEPHAALIGKNILAQGGSAADAAAAIGFALAVTLPSRAGLGAGGACLAYSPAQGSINHGQPEAIVFTSAATGARGGDRPAAAPMLARGMLAVQARYGVLPIERIIAPAEQLARLGTPVSRSLAQDLLVVGPALLADPAAGRLFGAAGAVLGEGDVLTQPDLGNTLARLRVQGIGDLYQGALARTLVTRTPSAGGPLTESDLRAALPVLAAPLVLPAGHDHVAFLPPPADGGLAAAAAFQRLQVSPADIDEAQARALGFATQYRTTRDSDLNSTTTPPGNIVALPASTSFVVLDRTGGAVACALSMGNLFGTGRVVPGTGMLLAASPAAVAPPLLAAALAWNPGSHAFRAAVAGSGQTMASLGVALGMLNALKAKTAMPSTVPSPGRINAVACAQELPGDEDQCNWATDPRGTGLAVGAN